MSRIIHEVEMGNHKGLSQTEKLVNKTNHFRDILINRGGKKGDERYSEDFCPDNSDCNLQKNCWHGVDHPVGLVSNSVEDLILEMQVIMVNVRCLRMFIV